MTFITHLVPALHVSHLYSLTRSILKKSHIDPEEAMLGVVAVIARPPFEAFETL